MSEAVKSAVHGFGRIGMPYARLAIEDEGITLCAVGGREIDAHDISERLLLDSVHGRFRDHVVEAVNGQLLVDKQAVGLVDTTKLLPTTWSAVANDLVVVDATGAFTTSERATRHLQAGAGSVVITSPVKDPGIPTIVRGVNDTEDLIAVAQETRMVAVSSCSTNCIAPILSLFKDHFAIESASAQVVHARTNSQPHLDGRGDATSSRRSADNIVASSTGSATEVNRLLPGIQFYSNSIRVPVPNGSLAVINMEITGELTADDVYEVLKRTAENPQYAGIVGTSEHDLFSGAIIGEPYSSMVDLNQVRVTPHKGRTSVELQAWFDNEWGYANRVKEIAKAMGGHALETS